jgi:hypothetical protein
MSFEGDLKLFAGKVLARHKQVFVGSVQHVHTSVVDGSPVTGAPGQPVAPVGGGNLRLSWIQSYPAEYIGEVSTNVEYAPAIEEGQQEPYVRNGKTITPRPMTLRSAVGGFHSVNLTRSNWDRVVEHEVREATR